MISTIWLFLTLIVSYNNAEFIQEYPIYNPARATYPLLCRAQEVLREISSDISQPSLMSQQSIQIPVIQQQSFPYPFGSIQLEQTPVLVKQQPREHHVIKPLLPQLLQQSQNSSNELLLNSFGSKISSEGIRFLLPFMDINIEIDRPVHIMQETITEDIFILHGHELFQLFLSRQEKRLSLMCYLHGNVRVMESKAAEIILWDGHLVLVIALQDHMEIYHIRKDLLQSRAELLKDPRRMHEPAPVFPAMQQLSLRGNIERLFVVNPNAEQLMIVAIMNFSKLYGKISTFVMAQNFFEPKEELTIPALNVVTLINSQAKYLITGKLVKNKTKTILTVYHLESPSLQLRNLQTFTVDSPLVQSVMFQNKSLIIACAPKQMKCNTYLQQKNGTFLVFKERTSQELAFNHITANSKFIMASKPNQIMLFPDHFLDSYAKFTPDLQDISKVLGHYNSKGENFVLVLQKLPFRLLIRTVEIELNEKFRKARQVRDEEESPLAAQHKIFLKSLVDRARSFLPPRKEDMNIFHRMADLMIPKSKRFETKKNPSNNPFEKFMEMFIPKKPEPEEIDIIDMFENLFSPKSKQPKSGDTKMDFFGLMDDIIKTDAKDAEYKDPITKMFENFVGFIRPRRTILQSEDPVKLKSGSIKKIQIQNAFLKSPKEIWDHVNEMRNKYLGLVRGKREDRGGAFEVLGDLKNHLKVKRMKVKNLIYQGELIKGFSLTATSEALPKLVITPKITAQRLNASHVVYPQQKRDVRQFVPDLYYDLLPSKTKKHLRVDTINGMAWLEFYDSIFLKNRDAAIKGRLVLQSPVVVDHLSTPHLNDLVVDQLFNLRQPQVIKSDLIISRFLVNDLKADHVNGLKFEEDIVFSGRDAYVETPVTMHHLSISGDLIVADKKIERFSDNRDEMQFKQFYTNKVEINGTLVINNIKRENGNQTKIVIDEKEFQEDEIKQKYLLNNEEQHFQYPVKFDNSKVIAPQLQTKYLNNYPTENHMLRDAVNNTKPLLIVFMKTLVMGDIICRDYKSKLAEIKENLIRPGDVVKITGLKRFEAPLAVDNLETYKLNELEFKDFVFKTDLKGPMTFQDTKRFNKLFIRNPAFVENAIDAMYLNNLALEDLLNHDYHMDRLYVPHTLMVSNMIFHKINGIAFDDFFVKLGIKDNQLILHKDLIVEGNVVFVDPVELEFINDLQWNLYVDNMARTNEKAIIEGSVVFHSDLSVKEDLWAAEVNDINLQVLFENILSKSRPQLITGYYTFDNMKASNVDLLSINNRATSEYIDLSKDSTEILGDVVAPKIIVKGSLKAFIDQPFNFDNLSNIIKTLSSRPWRNIRVLQNATSNEDSVRRNSNIQEELLKYLYKNAVRSNGQQVITGNVKLTRPMIKNLATRLQFPNNIDLKFIENDGVMKTSSFVQTVRGNKNFQKSVFSNNVKAQKGLTTNSINNIDVLRFNQSLYRLSSKLPLMGKLKFLQPFTIGHLVLKGTLNGLDTSLIFELKNNSVLPPVAMTQLFIHNDIVLKSINHMNLQYFLDNRVTLKGPALEIFGFLKFENLIIKKDALLRSINRIAIDNMVFRHSTSLQTFTGHKSVQGFVELAGPAHVKSLNGKDLMELYRNTLFIDQNYVFDKLIVDKLTLERGFELTNNDDSRERAEEPEDKDVGDKKQDLQNLLETMKENINFNNGQILYLDYATNITVKWQKSLNASIDYVNLKELARISCCEKQFLKLSFSQVEQTLYLENITSNRLSKTNENIAVKVENYCKYKYRKVKAKISITAPKLLKVFGLKRYVEAIDILSSPWKHTKYIIFHALDLPALKRNEVRIFKIDMGNNSVTDWQGLTQNIGSKVKVFQLSNSITTLITNGLVNNHPSLTLYSFNNTLEKFKLQQIIDGDYDIIEVLQLKNDNTTHLIITCQKCQKIFIYDYNNNAMANFKIYQIISFKTNIDKLFMFNLKSDNYMLVLSENDSGFYYLYKYSYIKGWVLLTYGYFPNLQMSIPLTDMWLNEGTLQISENSDNIPILVLCSNIDKCHIVNAVVQK